jgi:hypothetical protein
MKKNEKTGGNAMIILVIFLVVFGIFIFLITRPSQLNKAVNEVNKTISMGEVKGIFEKYGDFKNNEDFVKSVREKLNTFGLSKSEIEDCIKWLPPAPKSLNVIVVPDLSGRIIDKINNPDQKQTDLELLNHIWDSFENATKLKKDSKDRLIVDVTDAGLVAKGEFKKLADSLIFDLSAHKGIGSLYFKDLSKKNLYKKYITQLYELASDKPLGADYWSYFKRNLPKHIKESTLFDSYENLLIIITDGYLEAQKAGITGIWAYTGDFHTRNSICHGKKNMIKIPETGNSFPNLKVLVLEIRERHSRSPQEPYDPGTLCDFEILGSLWKDWFKSFKIINADDDFFIPHNDAKTMTKEKIKEFIK